MSQPSSGSGQRSVSQPFFIPTLMPMRSLQQQQVVITSGTSGVAPVITTAAYGQNPAVSMVPAISVIQQATTLSTDLYLCATSNNATGMLPQICSKNLPKILFFLALYYFSIVLIIPKNSLCVLFGQSYASILQNGDIFEVMHAWSQV